ncbi:unnamed protein product, partial [Trichogramma brassicae]
MGIAYIYCLRKIARINASKSISRSDRRRRRRRWRHSTPTRTSVAPILRENSKINAQSAHEISRGITVYESTKRIHSAAILDLVDDFLQYFEVSNNINSYAHHGQVKGVANTLELWSALSALSCTNHTPRRLPGKPVFSISIFSSYPQHTQDVRNSLSNSDFDSKFRNGLMPRTWDRWHGSPRRSSPSSRVFF